MKRRNPPLLGYNELDSSVPLRETQLSGLVGPDYPPHREEVAVRFRAVFKRRGLTPEAYKAFHERHKQQLVEYSNRQGRKLLSSKQNQRLAKNLENKKYRARPDSEFQAMVERVAASTDRMLEERKRLKEERKKKNYKLAKDIGATVEPAGIKAGDITKIGRFEEIIEHSYNTLVLRED